MCVGYVPFQLKQSKALSLQEAQSRSSASTRNLWNVVIKGLNGQADFQDSNPASITFLEDGFHPTDNLLGPCRSFQCLTVSVQLGLSNMTSSSRYPSAPTALAMPLTQDSISPAWHMHHSSKLCMLHSLHVELLLCTQWTLFVTWEEMLRIDTRQALRNEGNKGFNLFPTHHWILG